MLDALASLTGGGGISAGPSTANSSVGAVGGDTFSQDFGGINVNQTPWWVWLVLIAVVGLLFFKVFIV